jgi:predicted permease
MSLLLWMEEMWARVRRRVSDEELEDEIRAHLEIEIDENIDSGMAPEEARFAARRKFGNVALAKEMTREVWRFVWLDSLCQDVRIAVRMLAKNRIFSFIAVFTLAVGIGSTTAIFSVVCSVLFPKFSYSDAGRIVYVNSTDAKSVRELTVYRPTSVDWGDQGEPERVAGIETTANIFRMAGVSPSLGRDFDPDADTPGKGDVVILGRGFWQRRFGGTPDIVGRSVLVNNKPYSVIGVMPADKGFPSADINYWIPWVIDNDPLRSSTIPMGGYTVAGRLKEGMSLVQARSIMNVLETRLGQSDRIRKKFGVGLRAATDSVNPVSKSTVWTLFGAVVFVLLVACVNVANLLLARASVRSQELAIRTALGASRARIIRYLLTECLLLAVAGGAAGILLAYWGGRLFLALKAPGVPGPTDARLDLAVLLFAVGTSTLTALLFGLLPSLHASKTDLVAALKQGIGPLARQTGKRKRAALVVMEVAIALILLAGAGLMMNSFVRLQDVELGFNPENVIAFRVTIPESQTQKPELDRGIAFVDELLQRLQLLPQVHKAAASSIFPLDGLNAMTSARIQEASPGNGHWLAIEPVAVTEAYFQTMQIPVRLGRTLAASDGLAAAPVVVLSQEAARQFCPGVDPVGKKLFFAGERIPRQVVGVVANVRYGTLQAEFGPKVYVQAAPDWMSHYVTFVVRSDVDPRTIAAGLKREVWTIDPKMPIEMESLKDLFEPHIATPRFYLGLFGCFAFVAVLMAVIGLYGLVNYSVGQRTHEFGIRMALGAQAKDVLGTVAREGALTALAGTGLGLVGALCLTRFIKSFLFGVAPTDGITLIIVSLVLVVVAILACLIPARRASRIEPSIALKYE